MKRRAQSVAEEIADEIGRQLGPVPPEALADRSEVICAIFEKIFDRHQIYDEATGVRVMGFVPQFLADRYRQRAEFNARLDVAIRLPRRDQQQMGSRS